MFAPRTAPIVQWSATNNSAIVLDPSSRQPIAQTSASDGSGHGFTASAPSIIWVAFSFVIGVPLAIAGVRGHLLTTGITIGLAFTVSSWAAFINSLSAPGIADLTLTLIVLGFFLVGFVLGAFPFARIVAITALGILGGFAIGVRVAIVKTNLLFSSTYFANWLVTAAFAAAGAVLVTWKQRAGILLGCASVGSFFTGLGVDLIINDQDGMSRGLRMLFDRNDAHILDFLQHGYHPPTSTQIIIAASIGLIPLLAYAQHRVFVRPFGRAQAESTVYEDEPLATLPVAPALGEKPGPPRASGRFSTMRRQFVSRFSL
ncbi:hypothetical protein FA95DRAFT_1490314 [Auriscalpium vulgare]|uniref:Uncharacterized protein n=1 Tax=Auriscalpium vulgare TaxID=40419 RepID=A0ACB8RX54_9AGAM|nr:hypothetical protein FA95DRAFT_1490314 [Auriscalpium vulgare]